MPKSSKRQPDPSEVSSFYTALSARAAERRQQIEKANEQRRKEVEPKLETDRCLRLAAWGDENKPAGSLLGDRITVDNRTWAKWIVDAARAWKTHPGAAALNEQPLPDQGLGIEAARRIFNLAIAGEPASRIATELRQARETLGPWNGSIPLPDTEVGILAFFRQLYRYYDGSNWNPPRLRVRENASTPKPPLVTSGLVEVHTSLEKEASDESEYSGETDRCQENARDWPTDLGEAIAWLATLNVITTELRLNREPWLRDVKNYLGRPMWAAPRCRSLYELGSLLEAIEAAAPPGHFKARPLRTRLINKRLLRSFKPPGFTPRWASRATVRPDQGR